LWDAEAGKALKDIEVLSPEVISSRSRSAEIVVSADGTRGLSPRAPITIIDLTSGSKFDAAPEIGESSLSHRFAHTADLSQAVFWPSRPTTVWDLANRKKGVELDVPGVIRAAAFSPSGDRLVTLASVPDGTGSPVISGWDLKSGKKLGSVAAPDTVTSVAIGVANDTSAVVSSDGQLWAVDYERGRVGDLIDTFDRSGMNYPGPIAFSRDGKRFAAAVITADPVLMGIRVYEWPSGRLLHTFPGHWASVSSLAFSPDGKTLASGSADTTVLLWDLSELKKK
jgi:WD40 repeat protein